MSDITPGYLFVPSEGRPGLTSTKLNAAGNGATINPSFVASKPAVSSVTSADQLLVLTAGGTYARVPATAVGGVGGGGGDMYKATYDTNNNGVVDTCDSLAWTAVTGKPTSFAPAAHAPSHLDNGSDPIPVVTASRTGLVPILANTATKYLRDDGTWQSGPSGPTGPTGPPGSSGTPAWTLTTAGFIVPTIGSTVTVSVADTSWAVVGEYVWVQSAPGVADALQITAKASTTVTLLNPPTAGMQVSGDAGNLLTLGSDSLAYLPSSAVQGVTKGVGYWDPAKGLFFQDDFCLNNSGGPSGDLRYASAVGTGGAVNSNVTYGQNATLKVIGCVELVTGASASNSGAGLCWGGNFPIPYFSIVYGLAALTFKSRVFLESALPATGGGYALRIGIAQVAGTLYFNQPSQGFYFEYSPDNNSGQWRVGVGTGTITYTNTATAVAFDTAYDLEIDVNATWTSIAFLINGITVATISSGIPTTTGMPIWQYAKASTGAVSQKAAIDYWMIYYPVAR